MGRASTSTTSFVTACALAAAASVAIVGASLSAQSPGGNPEAAKVKNPVPATAASIEAGKASYTKYCRFCHGDEAKGDGKMAPKDSHPSDLTDAKWDRGSTDGEIFAVVQNGAGPKFEMKGFKGRMTDEQIWQVVDYVRSLGPTKK
jgi:mono/diheme cytochrome c family protein